MTATAVPSPQNGASNQNEGLVQIDHSELHRPWLNKTLAKRDLGQAARRVAILLARRGFGELRLIDLQGATRVTTAELKAGLEQLEAAGAVLVRPSVRVSGYRWITKRPQ